MDNRPGAGLSEYVLSQHAAPDLERARLVLLQQFYDALSARPRALASHVPSEPARGSPPARGRRPSGGWVVTVAPDFTSVSVAPSGPNWERTWSAFWDAGTATGWDLAYGARLCSDVHAAGLLDVHCEYSSSRAPGGSLLGRLSSLTLERLRQQMLALGAVGDEIDEARRLLEDPTSRVDSPNSCFARGRRTG